MTLANSTRYPGWLLETPLGTLMRIHVQPNASRSQIVGEHGEGSSARLKIRISSPPADGAANDALIEVLAEATGVSRKQIRITRGAASRSKDVLFAGVPIPDIATRVESRIQRSRARSNPRS